MRRRAALLAAACAALASAGVLPAGPERERSDYQKARRAVYKVFGPYASQAMSVVACETGGTYSVWARNGQYLGLFQMGSAERARWGHGPGPWPQARAAYRYFVHEGKDWSPWDPVCRP